MQHRSHPTRLIIGTLAAAAIVLVGPVPASAADADIRLTGGDANAAIVCGNVAVAQQLAKSRSIPIQRSRCTASATAGSVTLENVDIKVSAAAMAANRDNPLFALLSLPTIAEDRCENYRPNLINGIQINQCWAIARGGRVSLDNVTSISTAADGSLISRYIAAASVPAGSSGAAQARCTNVLNDPLNQRDDCTASGGGAVWNMRGVDVVVRNPNGTTSTRRGVTVELRGGAATANMYCFNVTDGSGKVAQINICNADAKGGDAVLRNVRFYLS